MTIRIALNNYLEEHYYPPDSALYTIPDCVTVLLFVKLLNITFIIVLNLLLLEAEVAYLKTAIFIVLHFNYNAL